MFPDLVQLIVKILLIAGAVNWGSVALIGVDVVPSIVGFGQIDRIIKLAIGVAGVIAAMELVKGQMKKEETA